MKYRKKPVVVDAWPVKELLAGFEDPKSLPGEVYDAWVDGILDIHTPGLLLVITLEGVMTAKETDMLIMGVQGEFYPCDEVIFTTTYEEAE